MVGRRGVVSREEFKNIFDSFMQKNQVVQPSDKVWTDLNEHILNKSNPKAIYTAALRWFRDCNNNQSSDESDIGNCDVFNDISLETEDEASDFNNTTIKSTNSASINFNIYISADSWKGISPVPITYNRKKDRHHQGQTRKYLVLKPGVCNCAATITGFIKQQPKNDCDSVKFCFSIKNFDETRHEGITKTVKNTGMKANEIFTPFKSALQLHQRMARNTTLFEKPKGFTIHSKCNTLRKISQKSSTEIIELSIYSAYVSTSYELLG